MTLLASSYQVNARNTWAKAPFVLLILSLLAWSPTTADARGVPNGFADLAERLLPSVVTIETSQKAKEAHGGKVPGGENGIEESSYTRFGGQVEAPYPRKEGGTGEGWTKNKDGGGAVE